MTIEQLHLRGFKNVPSKRLAIDFLDGMVELFFPVTHGQIFSSDEIDFRWQKLQLQFCRLIQPVVESEAKRAEIGAKFFGKVPSIFEQLFDDAKMFNRCDPASGCAEEVILSYPGFYAIMVYRLSHEIHGLGIAILPRILSEHAHSLTGIDIHPGATIGRHFYIDHGTGVVIGETCVIGNEVRVYQGVTLGAAFVDKHLQGVKRHPTIEDGVILYAGCTILGGETVIGAGSVVGGSVWLTSSIPPESKIFNKASTVG